MSRLRRHDATQEARYGEPLLLERLSAACLSGVTRYVAIDARESARRWRLRLLMPPLRCLRVLRHDVDVD